MTKQTARIENWAILFGFIIGNIRNHPRQDEFNPEELQSSSRIIGSTIGFKEGDFVETLNTLYKLGKPRKG